MGYNGGSCYWVGSEQPPIPPLDDLKHLDAWDKAMRAFESKRGCLLLGPPGTGKSTIMARIASMVPEPSGGAISYRTSHLWLDKRVLWAQVNEFCQDVKAEFDFARRWQDFDHRYSASGLAAAVPHLFLDDLGVEQATDHNFDVISTLLDARYRGRQNGLTTWMSTNMSSEKLYSHYGSRMISRLLEVCQFIQVEGEDMRPNLGVLISNNISTSLPAKQSLPLKRHKTRSSGPERSR